MFVFPKEMISSLETPCLVVDEAQVRRNLKKMQESAALAGVKLRPHVKTHKIPYFAHLQLKEGACGITSCKVSEAEVMAEGGIDDIFIAYPLVGEKKIQRAIALSHKVKRLILAVDSVPQALALEEMAGEEEERLGQHFSLEVRAEIDTGAKRTGCAPAKRRELFTALRKMPHLRLTGIYTFKGLVLEGQPTRDNEAAGKEEAALLTAARQELLELGYDTIEISGGSTPTGLSVAKTRLVDEIRPGTYIFCDEMLVKENFCTRNEIAVRLYATVVSVPAPEYAVIDGGTKTFPMDITPLAEPDVYPGYAVVNGREDLQLLRMNEEHGILTSKNGKVELSAGQILELIPIHVCPAVNLQNELYVYDPQRPDAPLRKEKVAARGMLT